MNYTTQLIDEAITRLTIQKNLIIDMLFREAASIMIPSLPIKIDIDITTIPNLKNKLKWRGVKLITQVLQNGDNMFWFHQRGKIITRKVTLEFPKIRY